MDEKIRPIIYIRGFAATMGEIENAVSKPYMGFNDGSTKIRQDHKGNIVPFIFESPLLRLMKDYEYVDTFQNGNIISPENEIGDNSIWIFRYYEPVSEDLGSGEKRDIPRFALDLRHFIINTVQKSICKDDPEKLTDFKVYIVAHSMGGLIARCYLQNICATGYNSLEEQYHFNEEICPEKSKTAFYKKGLKMNASTKSNHLVDKVFTYGTPHNGIEIFGKNVPNLGGADSFHVRNFNRKVMKDYLKLDTEYDKTKTVNAIKNFDVNRFFSFVGTNYQDYKAFGGISRKATGDMSDGLVMIKNAYVKNSPRAYSFRSHSGHYGLVNSEEGYQNLKRFLFGDIRIDVKLNIDELSLPPEVQQEKDDGKDIKASYHIETSAQVRNANYYLHERRTNQESAILARYDDVVKQGKQIYLFSGFLDKDAREGPFKDKPLSFAVWLGIQVPLYEIERRFWFDGFYKGGYLFNDTIYFHVDPTTGTIKYGLESQDGFDNCTKEPQLSDLEQTEERLYTIPLSEPDTSLHPRFKGALELHVTDWE